MNAVRTMCAGTGALLLLPALLAAQAAPRAMPAPLDADAVLALRSMGDYLRTLTQFSVRAAIVSEESHSIDVVAKRPDKLRVQIRSNGHERLLVYDGRTFTIWAPGMHSYGVVEAPPNIRDLASRLETSYGIELPLVDLFRWGTADSRLPEVRVARDLGSSDCGGISCQHYAFTQDGAEWEIWIQNGNSPLPRKFVVKPLTGARPHYTATYEWNLRPSLNDELFVFAPPQDAKKIAPADLRKLNGVRHSHHPPR